MKALNQFETMVVSGGIKGATERADNAIILLEGIAAGAIAGLGVAACTQVIASFYGGQLACSVLEYYLKNSLLGAALGATYAGVYLWGRSSSEQQ